MLIDEWTIALQSAVAQLSQNILIFIPKIIFAIIIFAIGWILASIVYKVIEQLIKTLKVDKALNSAGVGDLVEKTGFRLNTGVLLGGLAKWFIIILTFTVSLELLGLQSVTAFLWYVVKYSLPQIIIAVLILLIAGILADFVKNIILNALKAASITSAKFIASFAKWSIWVLAILVALEQLGIARSFIQTLFAGFVIALSLAFGLAFGLGGKDEAARILKKIREEITNNSDN